ncbi:hypothetical protein [Chondromyces crocatus]|uniref:Uncharacterized protein n=1 Tax=Chondromyces crocatus TaxID=52 RepID=A0A0K1EJI5_CHOCO|nr:hypothetical protein [Chondromyces crocatus]AKT40748.1 uncharacterized protein CMC5_049040 [Chondromyces crocatus]
MAARTLDARHALLTLFPQVRYTLKRLEAHPLGAPHIATFEALAAEGLQVLAAELGIIDDITGAQALVDIADDQLDDFAARVSKAVLTLTGDDREHPLYLHYFGSKNLATFKRPVLGAQLVSMRKWVQSLTESEHATLQALVPELTQRIQQAEAAVQTREEARQQNRIFRDVGERYQWVERVNAARKVLYGALSQLPHQQTALPSDFADQFFLKDLKRKSDEEEEAEETVASMLATIQAQRDALVASEKRLAELEKAELAAKKAAAERAAQLAQLEDLTRAMMTLEKEHAALKKQLEATMKG